MPESLHRRCRARRVVAGFWVAGLGLAIWLGATAQAVDQPLRQQIDTQVLAAWKKEGLKPTPRSDDATFLRRVHLDLLGTIPTHDEARQFIDDADGQKRDKLITRLLGDPRFAQHQATLWDLTIFGRNPPGGDSTRNRTPFREWLTGKFAQNEPLDRWVRALLVAEEEGSELFYAAYQNKPEDLTEAFSRTFLGTQLQCARCHDHPYTDLKQRDFYGMAGFFVRLVVMDQGTSGTGEKQVKKFKIGEKGSGDVLFAGNMKEAKPGKKGEPVKPAFLRGEALAEPPLPAGYKEPEFKTGTKSFPKPEFSRKEKLAEWATASANPFFARAAVNRVWGQFMGRGIVHPVDDFEADNKPALPALLDTLTREFVAHQFDLKWLIGELVRSEAYQLASTGPAKEALPKFYERARLRPLSAEEIQASLRVIGGDATQSSDGVTSEYFRRFFGEPTNGQGEFQGRLSEHLFLNNSENVRAFLRRKKGNFTDTLLVSTEPWEARVDRMFLAVLSRLPSAAERAKFAAYLQSDPKPEPLVEEALWVLVNLSEFRFNH
ncbi:MAG: hypothetical protein B9S33_03575 [Pedosphaera sp. Tous-C6FEB]|nr:MAG: hypothetical protein B9S33_03575 [Pedosphaera sp. Tous-C6FEB]